MEYIYAAMLLHKAGKEIKEDNVKKVLESAGVKADDARIKALIAALEGVNIDEAIKKAAVAPVTAVAPVAKAGGDKSVAKKEDKPKKDEKSAEQAAAGLGALFG